MVDSLDINRNNISALIRDAYMYIQTKTPVTNAFNDFIDQVVAIENVTSFEVHEVNLGALIDEIFLGIYNVNLLFEHKFKCKLFCESEVAQQYLNMATRSRINLTAVVATISSIIDGICYKGVNALLGSQRNVDGSFRSGLI